MIFFYFNEMAYAKNINFIFTLKKLKCSESCFLYGQGFREKKREDTPRRSMVSL